MSRIDFYQLKRQSLEDVLPVLLQKSFASGKRVLLKTTTDTVEPLNALLWTYNDESFLPHGSKKDGFAEEQPILITADDDNANAAEFLFLVNGAEVDCALAEKYARVFNIFDGNEAASLEQARNMWKKYKECGFEVSYWQQTERGRWEQKS